MLIKYFFFSTEIIDLMVPVIIACGRDRADNLLDVVEFVDNNTNCKVDSFPTKLSGAVGINGFVCGGSIIDIASERRFSGCWYLNPSGKWTAVKDMLTRRKHFTLSKVEDEIIAIGGADTSQFTLKSIETYSLSNNTGWSRMKDAPRRIIHHCTVMLNASYLFVIGGNQQSQVNLKHL